MRRVFSRHRWVVDHEATHAPPSSSSKLESQLQAAVRRRLHCGLVLASIGPASCNGPDSVQTSLQFSKGPPSWCEQGSSRGHGSWVKRPSSVHDKGIVEGTLVTGLVGKKLVRTLRSSRKVRSELEWLTQADLPSKNTVAS